MVCGLLHQRSRGDEWLIRSFSYPLKPNLKADFAGFRIKQGRKIEKMVIDV